MDKQKYQKIAERHEKFNGSITSAIADFVAFYRQTETRPLPVGMSEGLLMGASTAAILILAAKAEGEEACYRILDESDAMLDIIERILVMVRPHIDRQDADVIASAFATFNKGRQK